jgi:pyruvate dehydrogenase E2 component (dihydrolipoamide acetyltransferase)
MSAVVRMPQLAAGGAEAAIQTWLVAVGDTVVEGQAIVEIETEKAVVEHETEVAGVIAGLLVDAGDATTVGTPIAVIAEPGETAEQALTDANTTSARAVATPAPAATPETAPTEQAAPEPDRAASADGVADPGASPARLFASPLVRRLAKANGIDLAGVSGSGPNGRIVRRDIDELLRAPRAAATEPVASVRVNSAAAEFTDVPHTGMRRAIARRLVESKTTIPHFTLTADCRVNELIDLHARFGERTSMKPSVNDFVLKAAAAALIDVPEANAIWTDDAIRRFSSVDLAVAVSIDDGLVTPVLRAVERMSIGEIGSAVRELAGRGREGRLKQHELEGGSFSVSNLGMYGTRQFSAIINPPHSGILAVGAAERRPVVDDDGALSVATIMTVTLSADHRVLDGALAARWLAAFVARIENPLSLLL